MASGAHLTSAHAQIEAPSIFEVIAQERLAQLIPGALAQLTNLVTAKLPALAVYVNPETLVRTAHTALETHFLFLHNATASEHFYNLERVNSQGGLTKKDRIRTLAIICALPYFQQKLAKICDNSNERNESKLAGYVKKLYPMVCTVLQTWDFVLSIRYLMGRTEYQSLEQLVSGTVLKRARPRDTDTSKFVLLRAAGSVVTYSVTVAVFFVQFLNWWRTQAPPTSDQAPIPVPPVYLRHAPGPCRLCGNDVINAAVLSTSGYVFCYPCIYAYIRQEGRCPVTDYPSTVDCLVRLHTTGS